MKRLQKKMKKGTVPSKKSFKDIKISKRKAVAAILVTAAMLLLTILAVQGEGMNVQYLMPAVLISALAGAFCLTDFRIPWWLSAPLAVVLPFAALICLEYYTHVPQDLTWKILVLNLMFFWILYAAAMFLTGRMSVGYCIATLVPMLFGLANYFVVKFRSSPIVPWDFLSIGTAVTVTDSYSFTYEWKTLFVLYGFIWIGLISSRTNLCFRRPLIRIPAATISVILMIVYLNNIQLSSVQSFFGMDTTLFTLNVLYRNNGIAAAFLGNLRFLNLEEPDGYSVEAVEAIQARLEESARDDGQNNTGTDEQTDGDEGTWDHVQSDGDENTRDNVQTDGDESTRDNVQTDGDESTGDNVQSESPKDTEDTASAVSDTDLSQMPNVIVIMDEAFSDLSVWGDFETSEEVLPFFKSLQEEAVGGEVYVSVKGGNTANSEFEFLTGDTMGFLPSGSVPYQQYINESLPNLASHLKGLGYQTLAIHPYYKTGWDRDEVYEDFGFDDFLGMDSFVNPIKYRGYISDQSAFEKIIEQYENKDEDERMFIFEVTMQNHGGYSKETPDFDSYLELPELTNKTTQVLAVEKYLTLMNQTDRALEELVTYFREQDEPVLLLMFGDHQPSDYITNLIRRLTGTSGDDSLEMTQNGYRVPFVMWSNYGLEQEYYDGISVNYLSGLLMENAGIPLTDYQQYLMNLMETLPVINGNIYRDTEGNFYEWSDTEYEEILNEYQILQYNHLVDGDKRVESFFE